METIKMTSDIIEMMPRYEVRASRNGKAKQVFPVTPEGSRQAELAAYAYGPRSGVAYVSIDFRGFQSESWVQR